MHSDSLTYCHFHVSPRMARQGQRRGKTSLHPSLWMKQPEIGSTLRPLLWALVYLMNTWGSRVSR